MRWLVLIALVACHDAPKPLPAVVIVVPDEGADASQIEAEIVTPLEAAASRIAGVKSVNARIDDGLATITLSVTSDPRVAAHEVSQALYNVLAELPAGVRPEVRTARTDDAVVRFVVKSELPIAKASEVVQEEVKPELERLVGVGAVELVGIAEQHLIVRPDLLKLAASNVTLFDLLAVLRVSPSLGVNALGELPIRDYIKMHDVAIVEAGFDRESVEPAIIVHSQVGASNAEVRDRVRAAIAKLKVPIQLVEAPLPVVKKPAFVASLRGPSFDELDRIAAEMAADLKLVRDPPVATAETSVVPDRDRADTLGIPIPDIHATIRALTGAEAGMGVVDGKPVPIVLRCDGVLVDMLQHVHVRTQQGVLVPIADVVKVTAGKTRTILHHDRERAIDLSSDDPKAKQLLDQRKLPPGYRLVFLP